MNPVSTQQVALDNALVALEKRLKIEKCNMRIKFNKPQRKTTYQVTLDVLKLSPCYPTFPITAEVPKIYMHQFWNTIKKIKDTDANQFKLDKKKKSIGLDRLRPSRAQILWGMFYKENVDITLVLEGEPAKKPKWTKHPEHAKKSAPAKKDVSSKKPSRKLSTGVQIKDTPDVSVSEKKAPATTNRIKGIELLFDDILLEEAQLKKALKRRK
ncbi:hypothetical protein Tco_0135232 [Tanacetum coccineum]